MDCSPPGSSVHGMSQARTLEWFSISFSRGSSWSRNRIFLTAESLGKPCQRWWVCANQTNLTGTFSKMKSSWFFLTRGTSWWHTHWQDPLEKRMATHSSIPAWKIPWTEEPGRLYYMGAESDMTEDQSFAFHFQGCMAYHSINPFVKWTK